MSKFVLMNFIDEKVLISLISVGVGWLLAQGTSLAKDLWSARKLKRGLLHELEDIKEQMHRVLMLYARKLQIYALNGIEPSASIPIYNMFFKQYYKDVFSRLNHNQRYSYQLIHASLDTLNKKNEDFAKFTEKICKDLKDSKDDTAIQRAVGLWGDEVTVLYMTAKEVLWHVVYHLKNKRNPALDLMGPMHKSYLKFEEELRNEVKKIIEQGKNLNREDFAKVYDEAIFEKSNSSRRAQ